MYVVMLVSRPLFLMVFGLNLDVQGWKTKRFTKQVLQKSIFTEIGFLMIPGPIFYDVGWPWDQFS